MKDYYKILEVQKDATEDVIKKSYRKLAKKYHPDTNGGDEKAAQKFQEISEAYTILSDAKKRQEYDESFEKAQDFKEESFMGKKAKPTGKTGFSSQNFRFDFGDMMFEELKKEGQKSEVNKGQINYADMSAQFANFFGFRPK